MSDKQFNSTLKGTEIMVKIRGRRSVKCFVAEVDYEKGITIKDCEHQKDALCLNKNHMHRDLDYHTTFIYLLKEIRKGKLSAYRTYRDMKISQPMGSQVNCAFK